MKKTRAVRPGETIIEQLKFTGISRAEFSARMHMDDTATESLLQGDTRITFDIAARLERVLGLPEHFWMNLESAYREKLAQGAAVA